MIDDDYPFFRQVASPLTDSMLRPLDPRCRVVQFSSALTAPDYARLAAFLAEYPEMPLRTYGHSQDDLAFLTFFPQLRHFVMHRYEVPDFDGLRFLSAGLRSLDIGETSTRRRSFSMLARFRQLQSLTLSGRTRDIDAIGQLQELKSLKISSMAVPDLDALLPLRQLQSLTLHGTVTKDIAALPGIGELRHLVLSSQRGLVDLAPIGAVLPLQHLHLFGLSMVTALPQMDDLSQLRRVHIEQVKQLHDLTPLRTAPALEEALLIGMRQLTLDDLQLLTTIPTLQRVLVNLGSVRRNAAASSLLQLPFADRFAFEYR